ncbi:hypothetical protein PVL29_020843 [Vitis rotundifolia]|uniref:F-box domain-containing protein n=1 Tax=Vitis rotundifolia TaxID=103349 RepID=A0AA38YY39_VITRO|nr:hypothetical protein PVL29_020843 [Vitis rotundifolia]
MTRRVRRKGSQSKDKDKANFPSYLEIGDAINDVDWTNLPDDTVIQLFSRLNYRDRASLSLTCRSWRQLGSSPCLWTSLDLRSHKFDDNAADYLSSQCANITKLRFRGAESANAIIRLQARGLREISGEFCRDINDATLSVIAARHEALESLQLGPDACDKITSDAIKAVAFCCPKLKRLRISGVQVVTGDAINALGKHCGQLVELGFIDGENVDGAALGNLKSVRFLSVAGTRNMKWGSAVQPLCRLNSLIGIDVSRTDISLSSITRLLSFSQNLKVFFALNCPKFEADVNHSSSYNYKGKLLVALFSDIFKGVASLFADKIENQRDVFSHWRKLKNRDNNLDEIVTWIEWILSHSLLRISENNPEEFNEFWLRQGAALLLSLMQSSQMDVQERAATAVATFVVIDDDNATVDCRRAEAVMQDGGVQLLLDLASSYQEGLQSEAAKAIANLSVNSKVAKAVAENGGIDILSNLARSMNRLVAEEAAGGLWNLSVGEEHKGAIAETGGIRALVDLIFKWQSAGDGVLAARALANLAAHGDSNSNNSAVGQEAGALEALVQLTCSQHEGVRQEAAGALWNLSFDDRNREAIAAAGGVEALVALARTCSNASQGLQERAAGALWGLSVSEANSIAIGRQGGVAPLIALARSNVEDVHETAAGALWNLAFNPHNALRIVEDGGVQALVNLCSYSLSKMARFMAALALAYMFDGRMDEVALVGPSSEGASKSRNINGARKMALKNIEAFVLTFTNPHAFGLALASSAPTALAQVIEMACIQEAGHLRCSGAEIGRFVTMLKNPSPVLKSCAAFALLQFTIPGSRHAVHHASLLQKAVALRTLRAAAAAATAPVEAKVFARIVLRNLEHYQVEASI